MGLVANETVCVVCLRAGEGIIKGTFHPCGHCVVCESCLAFLEEPKCAVCRGEIDKIELQGEWMPWGKLFDQRLEAEFKTLQETLQVVFLGPGKVATRSLVRDLCSLCAPTERSLWSKFRRRPVKVVNDETFLVGGSIARFVPNARINGVPFRFSTQDIPERPSRSVIQNVLENLTPDLIVLCCNFHELKSFQHVLNWDYAIRARSSVRRMWVVAFSTDSDDISRVSMDKCYAAARSFSQMNSLSTGTTQGRSGIAANAVNNQTRTTTPFSGRVRNSRRLDRIAAAARGVATDDREDSATTPLSCRITEARATAVHTAEVSQNLASANSPAHDQMNSIVSLDETPSGTTSRWTMEDNVSNVFDSTGSTISNNGNESDRRNTNRNDRCNSIYMTNGSDTTNTHESVISSDSIVNTNGTTRTDTTQSTDVIINTGTINSSNGTTNPANSTNNTDITYSPSITSSTNTTNRNRNSTSPTNNFNSNINTTTITNSNTNFNSNCSDDHLVRFLNNVDRNTVIGNDVRATRFSRVVDSAVHQFVPTNPTRGRARPWGVCSVEQVCVDGWHHAGVKTLSQSIFKYTQPSKPVRRMFRESRRPLK